MSKKNILISICLLVLAFLGSIIIYNSLNQNKKSTIYTINYFDGSIPGNNYTISIDTNYNIEVVDQPSCSTPECLEGTYKPKSTTYTVNFNENSKLILKDFLNELFEGESSNIISLDFNENITNKELIVLQAIIYNDESILKNY